MKILLCLLLSAAAVVFIFAQTQVPIIAPSTVAHRISAIRINPLASEAYVDVEYLNFNGEPLETRKLTLKGADYPTVFIRPLEAAIEAGLQVKNR